MICDNSSNTNMFTNKISINILIIIKHDLHLKVQGSDFW